MARNFSDLPNYDESHHQPASLALRQQRDAGTPHYRQRHPVQERGVQPVLQRKQCTPRPYGTVSPTIKRPSRTVCRHLQASGSKNPGRRRHYQGSTRPFPDDLPHYTESERARQEITCRSNVQSTTANNHGSSSSTARTGSKSSQLESNQSVRT